MGRLDNKVAFITGAARGQGRSHAVRLASEGADINAVNICRQIESVRYPLATPDDLETTRKEVEKLVRRIVAVQADVRDRAELKAALDQGLAEFGRLDVVCANAGVCPMEDVTLIQGFVDAMDVDFGGVLSTVAVALPHLGPGASAMPIPYLQPSDVSELVTYLASDESRYMTGMNIRLDAGAMLKTPPL